ncbi:hypothetical protein DF046_37455 [Burkholderia cepacia]|nr:hypothetical protein DF046_37455 [Burkholderia cepacia]
MGPSGGRSANGFSGGNWPSTTGNPSGGTCIARRAPWARDATVGRQPVGPRPDRPSASGLASHLRCRYRSANREQVIGRIRTCSKKEARNQSTCVLACLIQHPKHVKRYSRLLDSS